MTERQQSLDQQQQQTDIPIQSPPLQPQTPTAVKDDMIACVMDLEASLLPCLPARELQAIDRSAHPSHQSYEETSNMQCGDFIFPLLVIVVDVERYARDFMEAAKKLQLYFISLQREDQPSRADMLRKEIASMEEELKAKTEIIKKQDQLIQRWRNEVKEQLDKHKAELERV